MKKSTTKTLLPLLGLVTLAVCGCHNTIGKEPKPTAKEQPVVNREKPTSPSQEDLALHRASGAKYTLANIDELTADALFPLIPENPRGLGQPINNREYWKKVKNALPPKQRDGIDGLKESTARRAEKIKFPDLEKEKWGKTGWNKEGVTCVSYFTLAECFDGVNKQNFAMPQLVTLVDSFCDLKTWVTPFHDRGDYALNGKGKFFDLGAATLGITLAESYYLLGNHFPKETRAKVRKSLNEWIIEPYRKSMERKSPLHGMSWLNGENNWNAVCHTTLAGVVAIMVESRRERAEILAYAIKKTQKYIDDYPEDGYCSEGFGYWGYGFSHYLCFAEIIYNYTNGQVNLFTGSEKLKNIALFRRHLEMSPNLWPAFSDCGLYKTRGRDAATAFFRALINLRCCPGAYDIGERIPCMPMWSLEQAVIWAEVIAPVSPTEWKKKDTQSKRALYYYFDDHGVVISRATRDNPARLCLALKAGDNGEHHNHNDVGAFVVGLKGKPVITDPGVPKYGWNNFNSHRYENKINNSYGHPVPLVDGKPQGAGKKYYGKIINIDLNDEKTIAELDLTHAYPADRGLKKLTRSFVHDREADTITITDKVEFDKPREFGSALITFGEIQKLDPDTYTILESHGADSNGNVGKEDGEKSKVKAVFSSKGGDIKFTNEVIDDQMRTPVQPIRLGYNFKEPVQKAEVSVTITPSED